jgi:lupus La protein
MVQAKILKQVEFYFSDSNLPKDKFLKGLVDKDPEGWVELSVIGSFARMKQLTTDNAVVVEALKDSKLVQVSEDGTKVKRTTPLPENTDSLPRSSYAKGIPADATLDAVEEFFTSKLEGEEKLACVRMRRMKDKTFKGSVFLEFDSKATAERVAALSLTFPGTEAALLMMTKQAYLDMKKEEHKNDKKKDASKKRKAEDDEEEKEVEFTKGLIVHLSGLTAEASRETIKEAFEGVDCKVAFVEYSRGQSEGYVRLHEESKTSAADAAAKLTESKTEISGAVVTIKVLEGEEETAYWTKVRDQKKNQKGKGGKKFQKRKK